jgi:hypothetical protein
MPSLLDRNCQSIGAGGPMANLLFDLGNIHWMAHCVAPSSGGMYNPAPSPVNKEREMVSADRSTSQRTSRKAQAEAPRSLVHVGVRVDHAIADRLRASERGLSDEIRERLERTFKYDEVDPVTRELVEGLINIAALLRIDFKAEWHAWLGAYEAFAVAVAQRLSAYAPPSGMVVDPESGFQEDETKIIGRVRERDDRRAHNYPHLKAAQMHPMKTGSGDE